VFPQHLNIGEPQEKEISARDFTETWVLFNNAPNQVLTLRIVQLGKNVLVINTKTRHHENIRTEVTNSDE
jgi:hypothetical protein